MSYDNLYIHLLKVLMQGIDIRNIKAFNKCIYIQERDMLDAVSLLGEKIRGYFLLYANRT